MKTALVILVGIVLFETFLIAVLANALKIALQELHNSEEIMPIEIERK